MSFKGTYIENITHCDWCEGGGLHGFWYNHCEICLDCLKDACDLVWRDRGGADIRRELINRINDACKIINEAASQIAMYAGAIALNDEENYPGTSTAM